MCPITGPKRGLIVHLDNDSILKFTSHPSSNILYSSCPLEQHPEFTCEIWRSAIPVEMILRPAQIIEASESTAWAIHVKAREFRQCNMTIILPMHCLGSARQSALELLSGRSSRPPKLG
jgi:hypothetical protein